MAFNAAYATIPASYPGSAPEWFKLAESAFAVPGLAPPPATVFYALSEGTANTPSGVVRTGTDITVIEGTVVGIYNPSRIPPPTTVDAETLRRITSHVDEELRKVKRAINPPAATPAG